MAQEIRGRIPETTPRLQDLVAELTASAAMNSPALHGSTVAVPVKSCGASFSNGQLSCSQP